VPSIPARDAEPAMDELVPVLEVDRQQQRRHPANLAVSAPDAETETNV
jgi:hypothetical protein